MQSKVLPDDYSQEKAWKGNVVAEEMPKASIERKEHMILQASTEVDRATSGLLARLLAMISDAALAFDGAGHILLANEEAEELLGQAVKNRISVSSIQDLDVRMLFPPALGHAPKTDFQLSDLPFSVDGSTRRLLCTSADGRARELNVRADRVQAPKDIYLLVASIVHDEEAASRERERLLEELSRANRRLSGTLKIVLGTIDATDMAALFTDVLREISSTLEATGALLYLAESEGFRLYGASEGSNTSQVKHFFVPGKAFEHRLREVGGGLRLRVLDPCREDLRQGELKVRELIDEETREIFRVHKSIVPPYKSFLLAPVWFGNHIIAAIIVGWEFAKQIRRDDAQLLDAVASYLSVQLAGAVATLRQQRERELAELGNQLCGLILDTGNALAEAELSESMDASAEKRQEMNDKVRTLLSEALLCSVVFLRPHPLSEHGDYFVDLPMHGRCVLPSEMLCHNEDKGETSVVAIGPTDDLGAWLVKAGEPCQGAFFDLGIVGGVRRAMLLLRDEEFEPFDELEMSFLRRLAEDIHDAAQVEEAYERDRHISQALQTGMRNELQKVPGVTAAGFYTSATQSAFVGGDFYDLIRLPKDRACVIMGDVSGKGVEAASVSAAVKTALAAYSWEGLSPARMVRLLNDFLLGFTRLETFATLFVGIIDLNRADLSYCSAGHPPAILARAQTGDLSTLDVQSGVVGAFREMEYRNGRVKLFPGDVLLLYTDGTTEARAPDGAFFGETGLCEAVMAELPVGFEGLLDRLLTRLDEFTDCHLEDDVALVSLRFDKFGCITSD